MGEKEQEVKKKKQFLLLKRAYSTEIAAGLASIIPMNLFCIGIVGTAASLLAGQLVGVSKEANASPGCRHRTSEKVPTAAAAIKGCRGWSSQNKGPHKVSDQRQETPLYHCDVEFSLFVRRGGDFVNEKHRRGLTVWGNLIGHFWIISSALCCRISLCVTPG